MTSPIPARSTQRVLVDRRRRGSTAAVEDTVVVEEPLFIQIKWDARDAPKTASWGLTMRTPGHDEDLVTGLLVAEGVLARDGPLAKFDRLADRDGYPDPNALVASLPRGASFDDHRHAPSAWASSACGVCGRAILDDLQARRLPTVKANRPVVSGSSLAAWSTWAREAQAAFSQTGGMHAAALIGSEALVQIREDVGRHNAVDKVHGAALRSEFDDFADVALWVSGRAGFEIVQKAVAFGVPIVASVGAPTSLAVDVANRFGITLVGFLREDGFNVYSGPARIK